MDQLSYPNEGIKWIYFWNELKDIKTTIIRLKKMFEY